PSGLRKTNVRSNSLAHRTTWLRSDLTKRIQILKRKKGDKHERIESTTRKSITTITRARCNN
ncbi:hypothetical protein PTB13_12060, partial [Bacillus sp. MHSD17]|nr:hypothetical protein [Bacillus sp. MHSD17]